MGEQGKRRKRATQQEQQQQRRRRKRQDDEKEAEVSGRHVKYACSQSDSTHRYVLSSQVGALVCDWSRKTSRHYCI
jgi:hypothetical protein